MSVAPADLPELSRLLDVALALDPVGLEGWLAALPATQRHLVPAVRVMLEEARRNPASVLLEPQSRVDSGKGARDDA